MSNLLQQVAGPQGQYIPRPGRSRCWCGRIKFLYARFCMTCRKILARSPVINDVFIVGGRRCRKISLTKGQYALVWEKHYDWLVTFEWYAKWSKEMGSYYAYTVARRSDGSWQHLAMHRMVRSIVDPEVHVDHHNKDTLDNRWCNLRPGSRANNQANHKKRVDNTSGYIGVRFHKPRGTWLGRVQCNGVRYLTRYCSSIKEAALERDLLALKHHGEFAVLNFPKQPRPPFVKFRGRIRR